MEYTRLGQSGLKVSRIALGCMSFGDTSQGFNEWALGDDEAEPIFRQAADLGITFWDTANVYGFGSSEEIVGRAIRKYTRREDIVLATKVHFKMHDGRPWRIRPLTQSHHGTNRCIVDPSRHGPR